MHSAAKSKNKLLAGKAGDFEGVDSSFSMEHAVTSRRQSVGNLDTDQSAVRLLDTAMLTCSRLLLHFCAEMCFYSTKLGVIKKNK